MKEAENRKKKYILYNSIGNSKTWKLVYIDSADWWFAGAGMGVREGWEGENTKKQNDRRRLPGALEMFTADGSSGSFTGVCVCRN